MVDNPSPFTYSSYAYAPLTQHILDQIYSLSDIQIVNTFRLGLSLCQNRSISQHLFVFLLNEYRAIVSRRRSLSLGLEVNQTFCMLFDMLS